MRLTNTLFKIHNGWLQKIKWKIQGKRNILETGIAMDLQKRGITVNDPLEKFRVAQNKPILPFKPYIKEEKDLDGNIHYYFGNNNVVVYGLPQSQVLTNTVIYNGFPRDIDSKIKAIKLPTNIERSMHQAVLVSHLLDAEQVKHYEQRSVFAHKNLFKHKTAREYGITDSRKNFLLASRLVNHCERFYGLGAKHRVLENPNFIVPIKIADRDVKFSIKAELLISSLRPINPLNASTLEKPTFVNINPLEPTISLPVRKPKITHKTIYPIESSSLYPHTILLDYSKSYVKNLYEEPVNDSQFESRALLKAFTVCAAWARKIHGENVTKLDQPVVLQTVQFDKQRVQFGIFQLNTLDLENERDVRNYWFRMPIMNLYDECIYNDGRPQLLNYNFDVFKTMCVLYGN